MHRTGSEPAIRRDKTTALIALALLAVLAAYHVWDVRAAFTDFDGWWAYFRPTYPGDDYARVTELAERQGDWHDRYRAITIAMAIRRAAPGVETVYEPAELWRLWGEAEDTPRSWDAPGIKDDYFSEAIARATRTPSDYDPVLVSTAIGNWANEGRTVELGWHVTYVEGAEDDTAVVLHCDESRSEVYVVPLSLSPAAEDLP